MGSERGGGCYSDRKTVDLRLWFEEENGLKINGNESHSPVRGVAAFVMVERISKI
jgi:hypothetical protein